MAVEEYLALLQSASTVLVHASYIVFRIIYYVSIPLRYPLYYVYAALAFILSPLWSMAGLTSQTAFTIFHFVARLKYLYVYFACAFLIGICMAAAIHGSSSLLFFMIGVSPSQQPKKRLTRKHYLPLPPPTPIGESRTPSESGLDSGGESSGRASASTSSSLRRKARDLRSKGETPSSKFDTSELYEKQLRALTSTTSSSSGKAPAWPARRRSRGLLAQTIHEESSESESL